MRKWLWSGCFWFATATLWTVVGVLVLESYAAVQFWVAERQTKAMSNEYPSSAASHFTITRGVEPMAQYLQRATWNPLERSTTSWQNATPAVRLWMRPRDGRETPGDCLQRHQKFASLPESARTNAAMLQCEDVVLMSSDGEIQRVYGNGPGTLLLRASSLRGTRDKTAVAFRDCLANNVRQALASGLPQDFHYRVDFNIPWVEGSVPIDCQALPSSSAQEAYLFITSLPITRATPLPPDSIWEIPFVRFKKSQTGKMLKLNMSITTNSIGFWDAPLKTPKPKDQFRILCIGGSTTWEGGPAHSYPAILEKRLKASFHHKEIRVINAGIPGLVTPHQVYNLPDYIALEPDLILYYLGVNDLSFSFSVAEAYTMPAPRRWFRNSRFLNLYANRLLHFPEHDLRNWLKEGTLANIDLMRRAIEEHGGRVAICAFLTPEPEKLPPELVTLFDQNSRYGFRSPYRSLDTYVWMVSVLNNCLEEYCQQNGLLFIPADQHIAEGRNYFRDICHMEPAGIRQKAEVIYAYLREYLKPALMEPAKMPLAASVP